ncbi:odorant receptor 13a-like [Vespula squamosa]|uniref:Odorant receptor 13a-like n=1 Tax=Vespula squamosa TaxID=30214 RepID=A0ABD2BVT2_VESSQ
MVLLMVFKSLLSHTTLDLKSNEHSYKEGVIIKNKLSPSLADILEDSFNIVICLHMVGSTILLCTSSYPMLFSFARLEKVYTFTFLIYFCLPLGTLCGYCYTDECLLEEHELVRCYLSLRLVPVIDDQLKISLHLHEYLYTSIETPKFVIIFATCTDKLFMILDVRFLAL